MLLEIEFNNLMRNIHLNARAKGFWEENPNHGEKIALIHSELSEALEAIRSGPVPDRDCPQFSNLEIEMADAVIRIMDYCRHFNLDLFGAIRAKHNFNVTRPYKHKKYF